MRVGRISTGATAALVAFAGAATAHHGFGGRYDLASPVWIEGEVVDAYFGQPHAELTIRTPDDLAAPGTAPDLGPAANFLDAATLTVLPEMQGQTIVVEMPPTQQYFALADKITTGHRVAVVALRNCEVPHQLNAQWLRLDGGEIVGRSGAMSYMVDGC